MFDCSPWAKSMQKGQFRKGNYRFDTYNLIAFQLQILLIQIKLTFDFSRTVRGNNRGPHKLGKLDFMKYKNNKLQINP